MLRTDSLEPLVEAIVRSGLLRRSDRILVAVSGGPDSTALLLAIHELGFEAAAAHFDHDLRAGSDVVAAQVSRLCAGLGVELVSGRRASALPTGSVQAGARALRYEFFERARAESGASCVALAHTAGDLVEGAVMHLARGCGLAGLRGMPARRGVYVRPMLTAWRSDVMDFLGRRGIVAFEDPANREVKFARALMRHEILPALERDRPGITRRFYAVAVRAAALQAQLEARASAELGRGDLTTSAVASMPEGVAVEVMKLLYAGAGGPQPALSRAHLGAMLRLARSKRGSQSVDLPRGLRFRIVGHHMEVVKRSGGAVNEFAPRANLEVSPCAGCADPHVAHLRSGLSLRLGFRRPGLRMRPAGGRGSRKLQDIMVDARVPREERDGWPLVFAGERLAWVPGIAVDTDFLSPAGEPALHVAISPMPVRRKVKVVRLETPISPRGESS